MNVTGFVWRGEDAVVSYIANFCSGHLSSAQSRRKSVMIHHMVTNGMHYTRAL
jgi:hypothetical protein